mgnify:CR=1 FL=1
MAKQSLILKQEKVEEVADLLKKYKVLAIADLHKVRTYQLQELKKKLRNKAYLCVVKNTLVKRAIEKCKDKTGIEKLLEHLKGSNIFLFTNLNPFKLSLLLDKSRILMVARAGDVASRDIVVPAGNTGIAPGPIISQLNAVGIPTRIEAGSVWVSRDTLVAKKGEVLDLRLASALAKLGIKATEVGLSLKVVYEDGMIITQEDLSIDLDEIIKSIEEAHLAAFNLSIEAAYPTIDNVEFLLSRAYREAYSLALNAPIITPETIPELLRKAEREMLSLNLRIGTINEKANG